MNIGAMNKRITIQAPPGTQDSYGAESGTWNTVATFWANVLSLTGQSLYNANQVNNEVTVKVTMRYLPGILPKFRILFGSRTFEIISVINQVEANKFLELMCKELV